MKPDLFLDLARSLERAGFDYILLEDSSYVGESYQGSTKIYLENAIAVPRQDPSVVAALMTAVTSRIGIVPTFGTFAYPPYLLARLMGTLDQVSGGRAGWNMVTGSSDFAAMNFGLPGMPDHDLRYDMADEYMAVVNGLWDSWQPGAIVADDENGILVDHTKVHAVNYEGRYYKTRGPLNSGPAPQGRPVIAQAGGSPRGRQFAARHADSIVCVAKGIEAMKAYRDDVRRRMVEAGRNPDDCKILFLVSPTFGETHADAMERKRLSAERSVREIPQRLAFMGKITNIDFGAMDLDAPLSDGLTTNGHQQSLDQFKKAAQGKTLREFMSARDSMDRSVELVGSLEEVAEQMGDVMEQVGGDGFLFSMPNVTRKLLAEIEDGLVPALQRRGLTRKAYGHEHFRDNLLEF